MPLMLCVYCLVCVKKEALPLVLRSAYLLRLCANVVIFHHHRMLYKSGECRSEKQVRRGVREAFAFMEKEGSASFVAANLLQKRAFEVNLVNIPLRVAGGTDR